MKVEILKDKLIINENNQFTVISNIKEEKIKELIKKLKDFVSENR